MNRETDTFADFNVCVVHMFKFPVAGWQYLLMSVMEGFRCMMEGSRCTMEGSLVYDGRIPGV